MREYFIAPQNVIYGNDILGIIGEIIEKESKNIIILSDENVYPIINKAFISFGEQNIKYIKVFFNGECTHEEINRIKTIIENEKATAIVGFGGGKIMDTVKGAGYKAGVKIFTVPTVASNCASWASHSAVYTKNGTALEYFPIHKNPDMIIIDEKILAEAPERFLITGIGDTLAKWIETDAYTRSLKVTTVEIDIARFMAKKSYDEVIEFSENVLKDLRNGIVTDKTTMIFKHIIVTSGLIGGIGGEACRAVAAHAVNNGFTAVPERYNGYYHGEVVAFGNIVQMILDNKSDEEINNLLKFYKKIGIPRTLKDIGYENLSEEEKEKISEKTLDKKETIWNLGIEVTEAMLWDAIEKADRMGREI